MKPPRALHHGLTSVTMCFVLTWCRTRWFGADADRLARVVDERLREVVVAELVLDLLADFVSVACHLSTKHNKR